MNFRQTLRGTGVAIVTPFNKDHKTDFIALGRLIDFIISDGVAYIVTLGTTGEAPVLSKKEKIDIIEFTYEHINNRVPVIVGIGGNDTLSLVKDLESYPLDKATAVLSTSPYYNKPSQEGLFQHYKLLAEAGVARLFLKN